jgi:hypothetical protein
MLRGYADDVMRSLRSYIVNAVTSEAYFVKAVRKFMRLHC